MTLALMITLRFMTLLVARCRVNDVTGRTAVLFPLLLLLSGTLCLAKLAPVSTSACIYITQCCSVQTFSQRVMLDALGEISDGGREGTWGKGLSLIHI